MFLVDEQFIVSDEHSEAAVTSVSWFIESGAIDDFLLFYTKKTHDELQIEIHWICFDELKNDNDFIIKIRI